jgi:hypothetical protein
LLLDELVVWLLGVVLEPVSLLVLQAASVNVVAAATATSLRVLLMTVAP